MIRPTAPPRAPAFDAKTEPLMERAEGPLRKMAPDWLPLLLARTEPSTSTLDEPLMKIPPAWPPTFCWNVVLLMRTEESMIERAAGAQPRIPEKLELVMVRVWLLKMIAAEGPRSQRSW